MSSDRFDDTPLLDDLSRDLPAFGLALAHLVDEPIRAPDPTLASTPSETQADADAAMQPSTVEVSRANRAVWLAAAALLLIAAGFGLGRWWPAGDGSVDSTGPPDTGGSTSVDIDADEEGQSTDELDRATSETTAPPAPTMPSTIAAADGTVLSVVDDLDPLADSPTLELRHHEDVVTRAVLSELVRLEVFGPAGREEVADRLASDGLTITTTFDLAAANLAQAAIGALHPDGDRTDEVAVLTLDNRTGAIVATASSSPTSVLTDGLRQPGSAFKPVVLASLFEQGYHPDDLVDGDGPCRFTVPGEDGGSYVVGGSERGTRSLRSVTLSSNNCAFARLGQAAGLDRVVVMAHDLGLATIADAAGGFLSLPLGVEEVNGLDLAGAYATFANGGIHRTPWLITEVIDPEGRVLYQRDVDADEGRPVVTAETAALVTSVLKDNVASGTGVGARLGGGHVAAGKTGSTNDMVDAWFVGFTSYYTTVVWLGDPNNTMNPIRIPGWSSFGGGLPAAIWGRYNDELHDQLDPEPFPDAPTLEDREPVTLVADEVTDG